MQRNVTLAVAALAAVAISGAVKADDFTGKELQTRQEQTNAQKGNKNKIGFRAEIGPRYINRQFNTAFGDSSFDSWELGLNASAYYRNWFLTGGYNHSVISSDLTGSAFGFETDTWEANGQAGYQFMLNRNLTVAPFIGFGWTNTGLDGHGVNSDNGYGGLNFGGAIKWAPGYKSSKSYPHWTFFGAFQYFPDLLASDDVHDLDGSGRNAWLVSVGVEHNLSKKVFANVGFSYGEAKLSGPANIGARIRDERISANIGTRF
jgi:hypothetical protein